MFKKVIFSLEGMGYLHDVLIKNDELYARINIINPFNFGSHHSDDIWLDCSVKDDRLLPQLSLIKNELKLQKTIILHFSAEYSRFDFCHTGMTENDPNQIVHFQGKLRAIVDCFIDGISQKEKYLLAQLSA